MKLVATFIVLAFANEAFSALMTQSEFNRAVKDNGYPQPSGAQYTVFINNIEEKANIRTKEEAAMALTQYIHESGGLQFKRETKCLNNGGCPKDYTDKTCDVAGQRYFGRGYIQLTWCYNYRAASNELYGNNKLVTDPDLVARDENIAWQTSFWFWKKNVHDKPGVQQGQFGATTKAINSGECKAGNNQIAKDRYNIYKKVRNALSLPGNGDERGCYN